MRLHRLQIQAFGPFAGREVIDLDCLSDAGLFLLHGPTGAGKTSILDAVCFALYGRVPGARGAVTRVRSDHADPALAAQVVCEFSVGPRRFEVTRSPAWERPKKRGSGTTTQPAQVLLRERVAGAWQVRSTRIDEAGHLLADVLGLGPDHFTKLVVLPQGEFSAFLRADSDTRRQLLERLFGTDRFTCVQDWLREQRAQLRGQVEAAQAVTGRLLSAADQAARAGEPAARAGEPDPGDPSAPVDPARHLAELAAAIGLRLEEATVRRAGAHAVLERAQAAHEQAADQARRARELLDLQRRQAVLAAGAQQREAAQSRLRQAARAAALAPLAPGLRAARAEAAAAEQALAAACELGDLVGLVPDADADLTELTQQLREQLAALAAAQGRLRELPTVRREAARLGRAVTDADTRVALLAAEVEAAQRTATRQEQAAAQAQVRAHGLPGAQAALLAAQEVAAAADQRDAAAALVARLREHLAVAVHERNEAWQTWLDRRERRLAGIAAELAGTLADGEPCRVCGATQHPAPAAPAGDAVTAAGEDAARVAYDTAAAAGEEAAARLGQVERELAAASRVAGRTSRAEADQALQKAAAAVRDAQAAAADVAACRATMLAAQEDGERGRARLVEATTQAQSARQDQARVAERLAALVELAQAARGQDEGLPQRRDRLQRTLAAAEARAAARQALTAARTQLGRAEQAVATAAAGAGFASPDEALRLVLSDGERTQLEALVTAYDDERAAVTDRLADPTWPDGPADWAQQALDADRLAGLAHDVAHALLDDQAASRAVTLCENAADELARLQAELAAHLARAEPLLARFGVLDELTRCVDGTGGDNARRTTLSAYVLAARLDQVAQAASVRLGQMSGGRYTLVRVDEPDRGRGRAGLGLAVVDGWTGARRETATLSGGEAFYTSLALALGLADVVTQEAGGASVETLFVDEGFGSLDEDTLEEVLDVLDSLRAGGRAVGLVSHVAELRQRIPARVEVVRHPHGSRVRLTAS